jgi:hypothetical protein
MMPDDRDQLARDLPGCFPVHDLVRQLADADASDGPTAADRPVRANVNESWWAPDTEQDGDDRALIEELAALLWRIEGNYSREGSFAGSRFEGQRLEVVQARALLRQIRLEGASRG